MKEGKKKKTIIIIPDSFKGTISSLDACQIMKKPFTRYYDDAQLVTIPIADGGEGTIECFAHFKDAQRIQVETTDALMRPIKAPYVVLDDTAVIEMAVAAGFMLHSGKTNPLYTTTFGVGNLVKNAIDRGCRKIILGLGGSSTNDGGAGLAAALGTKFTDEAGKEFVPVGKNLGAVKDIDKTATEALLQGIEVIAMCDVTNPMYGENGAAYIFAPQKGASPEDVEVLDRQLRMFAQIIKSTLHIQVDHLKGGGAAGALGAGVHAFLNGRLVSGIDTILDFVSFEALLDTCGLIITGEGKFDSQSLSGKVISGITKYAKPRNIPVIVVAGEAEYDSAVLPNFGITAVYETGKLNRSLPEKEMIMDCRKNLEKTAVRIAETVMGG